MGVKDILVSIAKLRKALLSRGDLCVRTAKMLVLARDEVAREGVRNAQQTTLGRWFGSYTSG